MFDAWAATTSVCPLFYSQRNKEKLKVLLGGGAFRLARAFALPSLRTQM